MELPSQEALLVPNPFANLNGFDRRIVRQTQEIYEALPEVTGMHFTKIDQIGSLEDKGFVAGGVRSNYFYVFDKKNTDEYYGSRLEKADKAGLVHYDAAATIQRFHKAFVDGLRKYGLDDFPPLPRSSKQDLLDYLVENKGSLPAVVFGDLSQNSIPRKNVQDGMLSAGYTEKLEGEKILKTIAIDGVDLDDIATDIEHGISLEDACKKVMVNKTVEWLLYEAESHKQDLARIRDEEYVESIKKNPLLEWRKSLDVEFGSEVVDKIVALLRGQEDFRSGGMAIREIKGVEYMTSSALIHGRIIIENIRSKNELRKRMDEYSAENRKIAELLVVHSFGGEASIRLDKCKAAEMLMTEGVSRFGRPAQSLVYFGSLDDIELPLLAGAGEIYLVDPGLGDEIIGRMTARIHNYGKEVSYDGVKKILTFNLDSRSVVVKMFKESMQDFNEIEGVLAEEVVLFNKGPGMDTAEAEKALLPNGFCFDNKRRG